MADDIGKIYTPETIVDQPFPQENPNNFASSSSSNTGNSFTTEKTSDQPFPLKRIAIELLSSALNTRAKKILKAFSFTKSGAIQIGEYEEGVSGDVRITSDGITARNNSGNTTFDLDGDTGDAIFSGDVRAATFTSDFFNVDSRGNVVATSIVLSNSSTIESGAALGQTFENETDTLVSGSTITITLLKPTIVLITIHITGYCYQISGSPSDWDAKGFISLYIDDVFKDALTMSGYKSGGDNVGTIGVLGQASADTYYIAKLASGTHTLKLYGKNFTVSNTGGFYLYDYRLSYVTIGNY